MIQRVSLSSPQLVIPFTSRFFIKPPPEPNEPWSWCSSFWEPRASLATVPARSGPLPIIQLHTPSGELFGWPFERNDRNFASRLLLISGIGRKYFYCSLKRLFSLIAGENQGRGLKFLTANLDRHFRVSQQVEIPLGMFRMASFGRDCK